MGQVDFTWVKSTDYTYEEAKPSIHVIYCPDPILTPFFLHTFVSVACGYNILQEVVSIYPLTIWSAALTRKRYFHHLFHSLWACYVVLADTWRTAYLIYNFHSKLISVWRTSRGARGNPFKNRQARGTLPERGFRSRSTTILDTKIFLSPILWINHFVSKIPRQRAHIHKVIHVRLGAFFFWGK